MSETVATYEAQPADAIEQQASSLAEQARALRVVDPESYGRAGEFLVSIKSLRAEVERVFGPVVAKAHEAHKAAIAARKHVEAPLIGAESAVKRSLGKFQQEEDRRRREAEAKLRAEAKRIEEEARMQEALALEAAGQKEEAARVIEAPAFVPAISIESSSPKVAGVSTRRQFRFRIVDPNAIPREYLVVDEQKIRKVVSAFGEDTKIPGVEVYVETVVVAGGR